ncbi:hypothetical protein M8C21_027434, partial [Ambrosia artemisiifolia]
VCMLNKFLSAQPVNMNQTECSSGSDSSNKGTRNGNTEANALAPMRNKHDTIVKEDQKKPGLRHELLYHAIEDVQAELERVQEARQNIEGRFEQFQVFNKNVNKSGPTKWHGEKVEFFLPIVAVLSKYVGNQICRNFVETLETRLV